jgi:DNA-binding XRE family transcriptional regulator
MKNQNACGRNVHRLRLGLGIGQDELGKRVDLGRDAIAKIEGGSRCVTDLEALRLAEALECSLDTLLGPVAPPEKSHGARRSEVWSKDAMPSITLVFLSGDPEPVPKAILADLLNSPVWGKGSSRRPWSHALKKIGAMPAHIGALRILTLPDGEGNIPLVVLGAERLSAEIYEDGEVRVDLDGVYLTHDLSGVWQLDGGSQVYRGIRHALQVIRMV